MSSSSRPKSSLFKNGDIPTIDLRNVLLKGFLTKEGGSWKTWRRRFFVLSVDGVLNYFEDETMAKPKGSLNCRDAEVHPLTEQGDLYFEIATEVFKSDSGRRLKLLAESEEQIFEWVQAIRAVSCLYGDSTPSTSNAGEGTSIPDYNDVDSDPLC
mmetsp:Transcript_16790/g.25240  ORF Transcript_16790/g.25240 Transcript_16790/m.25240 type:complete len:155 (-) Transcript_16790:177-641(-)